jgi:hypothetical protein
MKRNIIIDIAKIGIIISIACLAIFLDTIHSELLSIEFKIVSPIICGVCITLMCYTIKDLKQNIKK